MRTLLVVLVALTVLFVSGTVATAAEWTGTQMMLGIEGTAEVSHSVTWSGDLCYFHVPMAKSNLYAVYTGPASQVTSWLWVSPQIGWAGGWKPNMDTFVTAGWATLTLPKAVGKVDLDAEVYNTGSSHDMYWYNQYNYTAGLVNAGVHWESTNAKHQWGPHVGFKAGPKSPWKFEARYFNGHGEHTMRLVTKLNF